MYIFFHIFKIFLIDIEVKAKKYLFIFHFSFFVLKKVVPLHSLNDAIREAKQVGAFFMGEFFENMEMSSKYPL